MQRIIIWWWGAVVSGGGIHLKVWSREKLSNLLGVPGGACLNVAMRI